MAPPTRDGEGRCSTQKQRPQQTLNLEHQQQNTQQRQRSAATPVTRIVARAGKACDTLVILSLDTAALARRTGRAKHAAATMRLLNAIGDVWLAGEALAESLEASA
jgi:hypothetical protein